ncbi:MAG: Methyltransferase type 11 [Candidatus Collierbacteria bacterium GW2011_GWB1_44_6]|uniref:Methyltransferase type 11 n=2 Tax=Candidatus Collieribacteriota TaxID=1752725 RepID=A0A0G1MP83_9BACT|nr:MAG: Methyltransferase type 11 [Candidatus Collierbacteria bacterium GW2011_GWC2_43_12]KKT73839.1 MAG: Methyltransferase type 11 [Candidatus Collierbacteria bacterium GW2011_GWB1_44_6]KKT84127.1 MAG: type 11 methyltransferase [Microgenomates group bacterium GW2011_GWC1_44_9]
MTKPLRAAVEVIKDSIGIPRKVLEVGSRQAYNQNELADVRDFFEKSTYVGLDMQEGPGVDIVASGNSMPFPDKSFDLVLCLETLEHADKPWLVCAEIERVLRPKGIAIVSSQQNFPIHKHPSDYFRYTPFGLKSLFPGLQSKLVFSISPPFDDEVKLNPQHVIVVGIKGENEKLLKKIKNNLKKNIQKISVHKPYTHRIHEIGRLLRRAVSELFFRQEIEFFS